MSCGDSLDSRQIRERRPAKLAIHDPTRALAWFWERERRVGGSRGSGGSGRSGGNGGSEESEIATLTILLAGAECPFTCVFCDLWRQTLDVPTPRGALPAQIRSVLAECGPLPKPCAVKLYNASNFFDSRAVPVEEEEEIAALVDPFARVTVECHPRLVGERCLAFARRIARRLEVAMGLETIHPQALPKLNKALALADFDRAAALLRQAGVGVRAFALLGAPFVPPAETVDWTVRSVEHALAAGAGFVSILPVREGNGALEALRATGDFTPPTLGQLEEALERGLELASTRDANGRPLAIVAADLWEAERFATCPDCAEARLRRLAEMNRTGAILGRVSCEHCLPH